MRRIIPLLLLVLAPFFARAAEEKPVSQGVIHGWSRDSKNQQISLAPGMSVTMLWGSKAWHTTALVKEETERQSEVFELFQGEHRLSGGEPYLLRWDASKKNLWFISQKSITKIALADGLKKAVPFSLPNSRHISLPDMPADLTSANSDLLRSFSNP